MRRHERIPLHDHSDLNSGGLVAAHTIVSATGGATIIGSGGTDVSVASIDALGAFVRTTLGGKETVYTIAAAGTASTLDLTNGNVFDVTLSAGTCVITLSGATSGVACSASVLLRQDGTGGRLVTWPGAVSWPGGAAPTLGTAAANLDTITLLTVDGGSVWLGYAATGDEPTADAHIADTSDAHDASAISIADAGGYYTGTDVEAALQEIGAGGIGGGSSAHYLLISDAHSSPLVFDDILQSDAGDDFLYSD